MAIPFDDPEVQQMMRQAGAVHRPGLAAELMQELGPLLAADGFDIDNLETPDLQTVNEALARAVERRNFERFVPVDQTRAGAVTVIRLAVEAINDGRADVAGRVLGQVAPEPVGAAPSIAQVIGVSLSLLDTWNEDPTIIAALQGVRVPAGDKRARAAARDILALAGKGRAFDSIGGLHGRHTGLSILNGGVLAVTGTLQAWAVTEKSTFRDLSRTILKVSTHPPAPSEGPSPVDDPDEYPAVTIVEALEESMRPEAAVEFRRLVKNAQLSDPVRLDVSEQVRFVRPFQWFLERVADGGIRLTAAGYLPPAVVKAAMEDLYWHDDWIGKGNREDLTMPVLEHREKMMAMKLLHRRKGVLLPTPLGRRLTGDPAGLWDYLAQSCLDRADEAEARATEFFLLTLASGTAKTHNDYGSAVAKGLWSIGWVDPSGRQIRPDQAFTLFADTWRMLRRLNAIDTNGGAWGTPKAVGIEFARYALRNTKRM